MRLIKKYLLLLLLTLPLSSISAQDVLIFHSGDEVEVLVLEVGLTRVKYKKFSNQDGPTYIILKEDIFMIRYLNGSKDVFGRNENSSKLVKRNYYEGGFERGSHVGFHITPGATSTLDPIGADGIGINFGLDYCFYLNDYIGMKTGFSYLELPVVSEYGAFGSLSARITSLGIPVKVQAKTGGKYGLNYEGGLSLYIPMSSTNNRIYNGEQIKHRNSFISFETSIGFNVWRTENAVFEISLFFHRAITSTTTEFYNPGVPFWGLQFGALFKSKSESQ